MVRIGSHATHTEKNQRLETANILLCIPDLFHIIIIGPSACGGTYSTAGQKACLFLMYPFDKPAQCFFVKAYICDSGKQPLVYL